MLNGLTPKDGVKTWAQLQAMTTGNAVGDYYYCSDGDGTNPAGNYRWTGSKWSFGGTGDDGYNKLSEKITTNRKRLDKSLLKKTVTGNGIVTVKDSLDWEVLDLKLSGKSVQDVTPTPDVPVAIQSVGKLNSATSKYEVEVMASGKNFFDGLLEYGSYDSITGNKVSSTDTIRSVNKVRVVPNTTLVLSSTNSSISKMVWNFYDSKGIYISTNASNNTRVVQIPSNCYFLTFRTYISDTSLISIGTTILQLELGSVATTYEPYKSNQITLSLDKPLQDGDRIMKKDSIWGVERNRIVGVFDGSADEMWRFNQTNASGIINFYMNIVSKPIASTEGDKAKCDRLKYQNTSIAITYTDGFHITPNGTEMYIRLDKNRIIGWDESLINSQKETLFKTWLLQNQLTVVYQLATPTWTPLSDDQQTLLNNLTMQNPLTNLYVTDALNPAIELQYAQDANIVISNLTNAMLSMVGNV